MDNIRANHFSFNWLHTRKATTTTRECEWVSALFFFDVLWESIIIFCFTRTRPDFGPFIFCVMECADVSLDTDRARSSERQRPIIKQHAPCALVSICKHTNTRDNCIKTTKRRRLLPFLFPFHQHSSNNFWKKKKKNSITPFAALRSRIAE